MFSIQSLRPNVSREEAIRQFSSRALGFLRDRFKGPLRSIADFYIPFRIFEVEIVNSGKRDHRLIAIDAVVGSLDPYFFEKPPTPNLLIEVETRNCLNASLHPDQAKHLMVTKVQRLLFTKGFFRMRNLAISVSPLAGEICIPYWVGFRGHGASASFDVIDAVRRQPEGARVRRLIHEWLTSQNPVSAEAPLPLSS
jgi:hypothetical protein